MRFLLTALLTACLAAPAAAQTLESLRQSAVPPVSDADDGSYLLSPGDIIEIKFVHNPELNEEIRIRPDGRISMGLIGELLVARSTIAQLSTRLATAYAEILRTPTVTIQVKEFANRRIFVGGEVNRPGMLPMFGRQTALGAVMEAGGFRPTAARKEVIVIRQTTDDQPRLLRISTENVKGQASEASQFILQPLDVVLVNESGVARTGRAVDQYIRQLLPFSISWLIGPHSFGGLF